VVLKELRFSQGEQRKLLKELVGRSDFSVEAAFATLEAGAGEFITCRSLSKFFGRNGFFASPEDIRAIVRRLDLNYDGVITREELAGYFATQAALPLYTQLRNARQPDHSMLKEALILHH
jgi:hypothetical protein